MFDLNFRGLLDFNATCVSVAATSPAGRAFFDSHVMQGAVGASFRKSVACEVFARAEADGLRCIASSEVAT